VTGGQRSRLEEDMQPALRETEQASKVVVSARERPRQATFPRGVAAGLLPLGLAAGIALVALLLAGLARVALAGQGFFTTREATQTVLLCGLSAAASSYGVACVGVLGQAKRWQRAGWRAAHAGALLGLAVASLLLVAPVALAAVLPQHPAP
jgi:hypothetical protein